MAVRGQRFELDLDAPDFTIKPLDERDQSIPDFSTLVKDVEEHESESLPSAPQPRSSKSGFPTPRTRKNVSAFRQGRQNAESLLPGGRTVGAQPSDKAIMQGLGSRHGIDLETRERSDISQENKRRIAEMSPEDVETARAELMKTLNPVLIERLLQKANIDEDQHHFSEKGSEHSTDNVKNTSPEDEKMSTGALKEDQVSQQHTDIPNTGSIHFPTPPRHRDDFVALDPNSESFLNDLKKHYFPHTPHDPSTLAWLQDPTEEDEQNSAYNPEKDSYAPSDLRFGFSGRLIPPRESLTIDVSQGLHHHGESPSSAGYTIPELAILARSSLPNQRCVAYQLTGRILYRLGRGDFGSRGGELQEALWKLIEHERILESTMAEANRSSGHVSARAYATEALWLWRKGGGGDRGILKSTQKIAS